MWNGETMRACWQRKECIISFIPGNWSRNDWVQKIEFMKERMVFDMNTTENIKLLEAKLQRLTASEKENYGVCRKIRRNIRNLERELITRT